MSANGDTLEHLSTWLRTESPTHAPAGVNRMMDLVAAEVADAPVAVERIPGRAGLGDVLVLRAGPQTSEPAVLVMSHLDTVHPLGTADHDLPVRLEGDRLYGPGCYDMKGGAYLALEAFKAVARSGGAGAPLVYLMTPDEEIGSPTTRAMIEDLARNAAFALVTEPARDGGKVVTAPQGRRPLRGACRGQAGPFRLAPRRRAQRHPRGGAPDPRHRGHDRLRRAA